ncbi:MAG: hypothetical protein MAG795_01255 [Candidatus Woesearchaeota archaeon]|nr:hypothetical protein [Candidatus Woesearchaeota archaeon]
MKIQLKIIRLKNVIPDDEMVDEECNTPSP